MLTNCLRQDLGGAWSFQARGRAPIGRAWLPATVPGNVHTDLMAAGRLPDPFVGDHEADMAWVEACGWTYRRRFRVEGALRACRRLRLVAEGLDTWCELRLNGRRLGRTKTMFVEHHWALEGLLRRGDNELEIRFEAPGRRLAALERKHGPRAAIGGDRRSQGRKAQYSFGWDWGPRLATSGIFRPIYLEGDGGLRVQDLWVRTLKADAAAASGVLVAELHSERALRAPLTAHVGAWRLEKSVRLKKGLNVVRLPWRLVRPRLWWPRGYGEPSLVQAGLSVGTQAVAEVTVGLRTVELDTGRDAAGRRFGLKVNGVPVFAKGANWIPADSFLGRVRPSRVEDLLRRAADGNGNCLRVWGGGLYESEDFYRACDRLGILVWQDFPFACSEVPEHPDFIALLKAEAAKALRRLRRHPSLALWCGNNENQMGRHEGWFRGRESRAWGEKIYAKVLPALCAALDPDRPYWPGSPYGGADPNSPDEGDRHHWLVWARLNDIEDYRLDRGRFLSEFGFAALPNRAALKRSAPPGQRWLQSRALQVHDKVERGGAYARIAFHLTNHLPLAGGLDRFRYLSQVMQARALRTGVEHWRRLKPHTQGALVWQHNDCWPVTSWSLLDADDTPKLAWFGLREAFDDVLLSACEAEIRPLGAVVGRLPLRPADETGHPEAWLCLDGRAAFRGSLAVSRWGMNGREAPLKRLAVRVGANRSVRLWTASRAACGITDPSRQFLVFELEGKGGLRRRCLLFFERPRRLELPDSGLVVGARAAGDGVELAVRARRFAMAVELHAPVPGRFSDNGFDLLPGETRRLRFSPDRHGPIQGAWQALCLNQCVPESRRR